MAAIAPTVATASDIQMDYMKLLVTQLQNQNPLEPMNNNEMAAQLSQFSSLQQLENMNTSFSNVLATTEKTYANSLIGKEISFAVENADGTDGLASGVVEMVLNDPSGAISLLVGTHTVGMEEVLSVKNQAG
ncbi:MAG: flagellar hook capping protein [Planctomycetes bacterium]|nr:flagellar hook capping protein [Planctomycetota bacterium]